MVLYHHIYRQDKVSTPPEQNQSLSTKFSLPISPKETLYSIYKSPNQSKPQKKAINPNKHIKAKADLAEPQKQKKGIPYITTNKSCFRCFI